MSLSKTLSYGCFLAVLIFAPLAFGTVEIWSYAVMEILIGACALLWVFSLRETPLYRPPGLVPMALIAGFLMLQAVPLPGALVRLLSPEAWQIYQDTAGPVWMTLSVHPRATALELARFLSYLVFYIVAVQLLSNYILFKRTLAVIAVFAATLALLVIAEFITRNLNYPLSTDKIFWIRSSDYAGNSLGPYVNRNHYAGLMEMIFPLTVALFLYYRPVSSALTLKQRLREVVIHHRIKHHLLYGTAAVLIGTSVFVSLSRAGIFSLTVSMGVFCLWLTRKTKNFKAGLVTAVLFVCILTMTGSAAWDRIFERFGELRVESGELYHPRFKYWQDGMEIIRDFPLTGSGLGTWQDIYPLYRTIPGDARLEHAHSDYIEFTATGGIVLVGLMALTLVRVATVSYHSYRRRRDRMGIFLFVACLAGVLSILLHALVEFNMQVGANGLYFAFILALMVSAAHTRFQDGYRPTYLPRAAGGGRWARAAAGIFLGGILFFQGGILLANYHLAGYRDTPPATDISDGGLRFMHQASRKAVRADPFNAGYHHLAAHTAMMLDKPGPAGRHYQRAIRLSPLDVRILQDAGYYFFQHNETDIADALMRAGIRYSHRDVGVYLNYAAALFDQDRTADALNILRTAMTVYPDNADVCLTLMVWLGIVESRIKATLPERVAPYLAFGDYLASLGRYQEATEVYLEGLARAPREESVARRSFIHVYRFLRTRDDIDRAREVVAHALEYFPDDRQLNAIRRSLE